MSVCVCVFTASERFDLLQDAMSVVCGPKMCVFRRAHIVYLSECASVSSSQSHMLAPPPRACLCLAECFVYAALCAHMSDVCTCACA